MRITSYFVFDTSQLKENAKMRMNFVMMILPVKYAKIISHRRGIKRGAPLKVGTKQDSVNFIETVILKMSFLSRQHCTVFVPGTLYDYTSSSRRNCISIPGYLPNFQNVFRVPVLVRRIIR